MEVYIDGFCLNKWWNPIHAISTIFEFKGKGHIISVRICDIKVYSNWKTK